MSSSPGVPLFQYDRRLDIVVHGKIYQVSKDARGAAILYFARSVRANAPA